jgi:L-iditol 2-dehydrogenase
MITHELQLDELPGMFGKIKAGGEFFSKIMFRP